MGEYEGEVGLILAPNAGLLGLAICQPSLQKGTEERTSMMETANDKISLDSVRDTQIKRQGVTVGLALLALQEERNEKTYEYDGDCKQ